MTSLLLCNNLAKSVKGGCLKLAKEVDTIDRSSKKYILKQNIKRNWQIYLFLLPMITYFFIFHYVPMYGVQIAFKNYLPNKGFMGSDFVGLKHFETFFNSYYFWRLLKNTILLNVYGLLLFPLPVVFALMLHEVRHAGLKKWMQTITYAPHFISVVVVVGMLVAFLNPQTGIVNVALKMVGMEPIYFMAEPSWFRHLYVWSGQWESLGWNTIIFLAALAGINPELYEAAEVDGASRLQRILHINIPGILPTVVILFILNIGMFMQIGFEKVLLMQNNLNKETSDVIQTFVYNVGLLEGRFSYATAIGLFESAINIVLLVTVNQIARKIGENSLW